MSTLSLWTPDQTQLISTTIAPGCSNDELRLFAYACQRTGLDPFSKQIYAIKRGGKMTIQAGIDGLRSIAERTGQLDGSETHWCGEDGVWTDVWLAAKPYVLPLAISPAPVRHAAVQLSSALSDTAQAINAAGNRHLAPTLYCVNLAAKWI